MFPVLLCGLALAATSTSTTGPSTFALQPGSTVRFTAHQTFSTTEGRFRSFEGTFTIDRAALERSKVQVRIEAASIDTDNSSRDDHLRNEDFFDVKKHPHIVFESTKITPVSNTRLTVRGQVRIKDKTQPVTFDMTLDWSADGAVRARGRFTVDRRKLGLTYDAPFYAPSLKDNVNLALDVRLKP